MSFAVDTFTDTNGTLLESHVPDTGTSWTKYGSGATGALAISTTNTVGISVSLSGYNGWYIGTSPASAEYNVQVTMGIAGSGFRDQLWLAGRIDTSVTTGTFYGVRYNGTQYQLDKVISGTVTSLGTFTTAYGTKTIILKIRNTGLTVTIDGVDQITSTDQTITAAGKAGITGIQPSSNTSMWDNFSATDAASPQIIYGADITGLSYSWR